MSVASLLRAAAMQFVSLDRLRDGRWEATYRGRDQNIMRQAQRPDPVDALEAVLIDDEDLLL